MKATIHASIYFLLCCFGLVAEVNAEENKPSDVFIGTVIETSTKYFHEGEEVNQNRANELYAEFLGHEPVYEKEWNPDYGEPPPKEIWDGKTFELPIKYEVSIRVDDTLLGGIKKEDTIKIEWESSFGCYCRVFEDRSLNGGRFLWITNPEKKEKRGNFIPLILDSNEVVPWIPRTERISANQAEFTTPDAARSTS